MAGPERLEPGDIQRAGPKRNPAQRLVDHIQTKTVSGLLHLLPLLITVILVIVIVNYVDSAVRPLPFINGRPWDVTGIGLVISIILFYIVGLLISWGPTRKVVEWNTEVVSRIPVVKGIFGVTQQATSVLTSQYNFSRVVFLEWPRDGMVALGFVTARIQAPGRNEALVMVYIPTVPNPTSGNMAIVVEDDVFETDLTVEDAMKLVFSGGIVPPDSLSLARLRREDQTDADFIGRFNTDR